MSYESKFEWDTNINSVGGAKDAYFVTSPYSNNPSANASQGALTYGNLVTEYEPPNIVVSPSDDGYYIRNRLHMDSTNNQVSEITKSEQEAYVAPSRRHEKLTVNPSRKKEKYTEMPGFRGSEIHQEAFTEEETSYIFVILMSVITFCIVGICFGFLIPRFNVKLANGNRY